MNASRLSRKTHQPSEGPATAVRNCPEESRGVNERICAVTGANSGVGFQTARGLASSGARVVLVCRSAARGQAAAQRIRQEIGTADLQLRIVDLSSLAQVRQLARQLTGELDRLDLLVNNAGVYRARLERTEDGFERTLAVNHLSHFCLTRLLHPLLLRGSGRVVNVSSEAHRAGNLQRRSLEDILRGRVSYNGWQAYADSKLANVLFTRELAARYGSEELTAVAVHPGLLATRIWNQNANPLSLLLRLYKPFMGRPRIGGEFVRFVADAPERAVNGRYFNRKTGEEPAPAARDAELAAELWRVSERLTGVGAPSHD